MCLHWHMGCNFTQPEKGAGEQEKEETDGR